MTAVPVTPAEAAFPATATYWPYSGSTDLGDCHCTAIHGDDGQLTGVRVEHADPRVLIASQLLAEFHERMLFGSIRCVGEASGCPVGDVFAIDGVNRRVVYVVTGRDPRSPDDAFIAEWPD